MHCRCILTPACIFPDQSLIFKSRLIRKFVRPRYNTVTPKVLFMSSAMPIFAAVTPTQTRFLLDLMAEMKDIDNPRDICILQRADASWGDKITRLWPRPTYRLAGRPGMIHLCQAYRRDMCDGVAALSTQQYHFSKTALMGLNVSLRVIQSLCQNITTGRPCGKEGHHPIPRQTKMHPSLDGNQETIISRQEFWFGILCVYHNIGRKDRGCKQMIFAQKKLKDIGYKSAVKFDHA